MKTSWNCLFCLENQVKVFEQTPGLTCWWNPGSSLGSRSWNASVSAQTGYCTCQPRYEQTRYAQPPDQYVPLVSSGYHPGRRLLRRTMPVLARAWTNQWWCCSPYQGSYGICVQKTVNMRKNNQENLRNIFFCSLLIPKILISEIAEQLSELGSVIWYNLCFSA